MLCTDVTFDTATYNCPCVNTAFLRSNPIGFTDCSYHLLMVIAKANLDRKLLPAEFIPEFQWL